MTYTKIEVDLSKCSLSTLTELWLYSKIENLNDNEKRLFLLSWFNCKTKEMKKQNEKLIKQSDMIKFILNFNYGVF